MEERELSHARCLTYHIFKVTGSYPAQDMKIFSVVGQEILTNGMTLMVRDGCNGIKSLRGSSGNFLPAICRCFAVRAESLSSGPGEACEASPVYSISLLSL